MDLRFAGDLPLWAVSAAAIALAAAAWLLYRRELRQGFWSWLLPTLRALAVALIVFMLAGPELVHTTGRDERGKVVLLVDASASMGVSDPQMPEEDRQQIAQALGVDAEQLKQMPRFERAGRLLLDMDRGLLPLLRPDHDVEIVELRSGKAEVLWSTGDAEAPPDELPGRPDATSTDLSGYIAQSLDSVDGPGRLAFALISDGRHNQGPSVAETAILARAAGAPVYCIAVGTTTSPHDLAITGVDHPASVFPDDRVAGSIRLIDAMAPGRAYTLQVVAGEDVLWESRQVTIGGGQTRTIDFSFQAKEAVEQTRQQTPEGLTLNQLPLAMRARITGLEDQDLEPRNNAMDFQVRAVTGQRKVLILAGRARWEMRYLDSMFSRDPRWSVTTLMGGPVVGRRWRRADSGEAFPATREALMAYDVIIMGELPPGTLTDGELQWVYEFVSNRAGGLIVVDGRRGHLASYARSPIAPLLPTRLDSMPRIPHRLELTGDGRRHASLRLEPDADQNARTWSALPPPSFVAPVRAQPGVDVVLVEAVVGASGEEKTPAVLTRRVGAGWVWYSAIDETWRWRRDVESLYQNRYWHQVTNRVIEPLYAAEDRYVSLGVDDAVVDADGVIPVRVRLRDADGLPRRNAAARIYLEAPTGERVVRAPLISDPVEGGRFTAELNALVSPGVYKVGVEVDGLSEADLLASTLVTVRGSSETTGELADVTLNQDLLQAIAQMTGGAVLSESRARELPDLLGGLTQSSRRERVDVLWQGWPWFGAVVGLLALELALRRRLGML